MPTKNETFLLAKINVLENVLAQLIAMAAISVRNHVPTMIEDMHHNVMQSARFRGVVKTEGNTDDAMELQAEIVKQVDYFFSIVQHCHENTRPRGG